MLIFAGLLVLVVLSLVAAAMVSTNSHGGEVFFLFMAAAFFVGSLFGLHRGLATHNDHYETITVTQKDRGGSDGEMRVYTKEGKTFSVHDSLWYTQWRSADVYGAMEEGKTYRVHTAGFRVGPFSWMPNIISAREVTK